MGIYIAISLLIIYSVLYIYFTLRLLGAGLFVLQTYELCREFNIYQEIHSIDTYSGDIYNFMYEWTLLPNQLVMALSFKKFELKSWMSDEFIGNYYKIKEQLIYKDK